MRDLDARTRLLLGARVLNGVKIVVNEEQDKLVMQQMVREGLFRYSDTRFSEGYWWTRTGERAAQEAWRRTPVQKLKTRYRNHPQVRITLNGNKEELCHVIIEANNSKKGRALWVRESFGRWLVDHPNGLKNERFNSINQAIEWALQQIG